MILYEKYFGDDDILDIKPHFVGINIFISQVIMNDACLDIEHVNNDSNVCR